MALDITPTGQACGAIVRGVDLAADLDQATVAEIRRAWLDHKVLAFPDQQLTDDQLAAHATRFGPHGDDPYFEAIDDHPKVAAIHRRADETSPLFADNWHTDWSFQEFPPDGTCLYSKVVPPVGGDTLFADQEKALAAVDSELRARLDEMVAVHSARLAYAPDGTYGEGDAPDRAMKIVADESAYATQTHPLVRTHPETGAATFYSTFGYIIGIVGMDDEAAMELLLELYRLQSHDDVVYRHTWEPDMLVMWDNRCILHKATGGFDGYERLLHRCTIGYNAEVRSASIAG